MDTGFHEEARQLVREYNELVVLIDTGNAPDDEHNNNRLHEIKERVRLLISLGVPSDVWLTEG
jgi:hypothetical protein